MDQTGTTIAVPADCSAESAELLRRVIEDPNLRQVAVMLFGTMRRDERDSRFNGKYVVKRQGHQFAVEREVVVDSLTAKKIVLFG